MKKKTILIMRPRPFSASLCRYVIAFFFEVVNIEQVRVSSKYRRLKTFALCHSNINLRFKYEIELF